MYGYVAGIASVICLRLQRADKAIGLALALYRKGGGKIMLERTEWRSRAVYDCEWVNKRR